MKLYYYSTARRDGDGQVWSRLPSSTKVETDGMRLQCEGDSNGVQGRGRERWGGQVTRVVIVVLRTTARANEAGKANDDGDLEGCAYLICFFFLSCHWTGGKRQAARAVESNYPQVSYDAPHVSTGPKGRSSSERRPKKLSVRPEKLNTWSDVLSIGINRPTTLESVRCPLSTLTK
ncbi:hypothetical protein L210DRAFT_3508943 [Boletus edulis BED1]|uniref:Uncharacterized protein n=1 Tax=Boletus edulis BED1 TaxID=1328754 RepID=A0AAD4BG36_BOLED|nr:hypothetical protein L210DRAFT_3508943 [Boletus edulis BED1]